MEAREMMPSPSEVGEETPRMEPTVMPEAMVGAATPATAAPDMREDSVEDAISRDNSTDFLDSAGLNDSMNESQDRQRSPVHVKFSMLDSQTGKWKISTAGSDKSFTKGFDSELNMNILDNEMSRAFGRNSVCSSNSACSPVDDTSERLDDSTDLRPNGISQKSTKSTKTVPIFERIDAELMNGLFGTDFERHLKRHNRVLPRVIRTIFPRVKKGDGRRISFELAETSNLGEKMSSHLSDVSKGISSARVSVENRFTDLCPRMREFSGQATNSAVWIVVFLTLTMYALFGPDFVQAFGSSSTSLAFETFNTGVFFLFLVEIVLLAVGNQRYLFSLPSFLDIVALLSFTTETALASSDTQGTSMGQMARSSRTTRFARAFRVARLTKLVPRLSAIRGLQQFHLASNVYKRRLRRVFKFLDVEKQERVTWFDLKHFYLTVVEECPDMLDEKLVQKQVLLDVASLKQSEGIYVLGMSFDEFCKVFLSTTIGKHLNLFHIEAIQQDGGVWSLTSKLRDKAALKVCLGILSIVIMLSLLGTDADDVFLRQGLGHLDQVTRHEHSDPEGLSGHHICDQLELYQELLWDTLRQDLLFAILDGRIYFENGACLPGTGQTGHSAGLEVLRDPLSYVEDIFRASKLRRGDLALECIGSADCSRGSLACVNNLSEVRSDAIWSIVMTSVVVLMLLLFVGLLNRSITQFSSTLLQPLHSLADDMLAMSSLELVQLDADLPTSQGAKQEVMNELENLQTAFATMRTSIRSWAKYVPPAVVQKLFNAGVEATIGVLRTTATILFCDIDGFEEACRNFSAKEVINLLTEVLNKIACVIADNRGVLLEYIESEVLAVFNTPDTLRHHAYWAALSAVHIHQAVKGVATHGSFVVKCRCAVNTASILAGNVGSAKRMKYGLLGDGVNLTARFKGLTSRYQIRTIASESVADDDRCCRRLVMRPVDKVAVKGKTLPTWVYEVLAERVMEDASAEGKRPDNPTSEAALKLDRGAAAHREGMSLYHKRRFAEAATHFTEARSLLEGLDGHGRDEPSRQLLARCMQLLKSPPPDDWDGVERLTKKTFAPPQEGSDEEANQLTVVAEQTPAAAISFWMSSRGPAKAPLAAVRACDELLMPPPAAVPNCKAPVLMHSPPICIPSSCPMGEASMSSVARS